MRISQTNTKALAGLTGLVLALVVFVGAFVGSSSAADDLTAAAYEALVAEGLGNVRVDFDGREATLTHGSAEQLARAEKIVEAVDGVRWAKIDTDGSSSLLAPPILSITRNVDGVNLSGVVPNAEIASRLTEAAAATFGTVSGELRVDPKVDTADWLVTMPGLIPHMGEVEDLSLSVDGDSLAIGGSLGSQTAKEALAELVEPSLGNLSMDNTLRVDEELAETGTAGPVVTGAHPGAGQDGFVRAQPQVREDARRPVLLEVGVNAGQSEVTNRGIAMGAKIDDRQVRRVDFIVKGS